MSNGDVAFVLVECVLLGFVTSCTVGLIFHRRLRRFSTPEVTAILLPVALLAPLVVVALVGWGLYRGIATVVRGYRSLWSRRKGGPETFEEGPYR